MFLFLPQDRHLTQEPTAASCPLSQQAATVNPGLEHAESMVIISQGPWVLTFTGVCLSLALTHTSP